MTSYLDGLDKQQLEAVLADPTPTKVMAGAGSGKTRVLTCRVAHQIESGQADPAQMFIAAYTKAAATEFEERVLQIVATDDLKVATFHGHMFRLLNSELALAKKPPLEICKDGERQRILQGLLGKKTKDYPEGINVEADIAAVSGWIARWKNELVFCDDDEIKETIAEGIEGSDMWAAATIYPLYEARLAAEGKLDFDDMLLKAYELLITDGAALSRARSKWSAFFLDEAQDTNKAQWEIVKLLADPKTNPNITIVGDTRQALYRFRGATPEKMDNFNQMYKGAKTIDLTMNYRSTPEVIEYANRLVGKFKLRAQVPSRDSGATPLAIMVNDQLEQAVQIADMVSAARDAGRKGGEMAVLIRTNAQSADIETAFVAAKIPYWCNGGGFFDRMEVGDIMAYLRLANDHTDEKSLRRLINKPTRYLGNAFVDQVVANSNKYGGDLVDTMRFTTSYNSRKLWAKQLEAVSDLADLLGAISPDPLTGAGMTPAQAINKILADTNYLEWLKTTSGTTSGADDSRKENIDALIEVAQRHYNIAGLIQFADEASALQEQNGDSTEICTVHRSKGREWPVVVVTNFYDGSFPHKMAQSPLEQADERRVAYVAYTRAKDHLVLMVPKNSDRDGRVSESPFITDSGLMSYDLDEFGSELWYDDIVRG